MYEKIKKFYDKGLYTREQVRKFWEKGVITEEQYRSIVGEPPLVRDTQAEQEQALIEEYLNSVGGN